jgi:peptidoglycan/xylan/chitin deacetylase (PgdA/CDA1 family)
MDNELYDYSPIVERPPLHWPNGAKLAVYVGLNVEHYEVDKPSTSIFSGTAALQPDPLNFGWRDYGPRVGIWRMIEAFDRLGIRPSVLLNSDVCDRYPEIIKAGRARNWAWLVHGENNSTLPGLQERDDEARRLAGMMDTIERATGTRPKGWMGPALNSSFSTPELFAELGGSYILDWCADDQPFPMKVKAGRMISVPYSIEVNDITLFVGHSCTGPDFEQIIVDQFEQLLADSAESGRVMAVAVHPFVAGQPFRMKYLERALERIVGHPDVWLPTTDEIADWYYANAYRAPGG